MRRGVDVKILVDAASTNTPTAALFGAVDDLGRMKQTPTYIISVLSLSSIAPHPWRIVFSP